MKAVGISANQGSSGLAPFVERELPRPSPSGHDVLVRVEAISVNPVDLKRRASVSSRKSEFEVLGWDAAGTIEETGQLATSFKRGDRVFYAGDITRPGSNAEFQVVDERIIALAPKNLTPSQAAAVPLTALTAYEALFDRLGIGRNVQSERETLLVIGGAGGVGSLAIQLAKLAGLTVYATAGRAESKAWCEELGADYVVDHNDLLESTRATGVKNFHYILNTQDTDGYWQICGDLIRPEGRICSIVEAKEPLDLNVLMQKSATFSWELMFTRPLFKLNDLKRQQMILQHVSTLLDRGALKSTLSSELGAICAANLERAHDLLAQRRTTGKLVLKGWV